MKTTRWAAAAAVFATATLVTACTASGTPDSSEGGDVTITFLHIFGEGFDDAIAAFEDAHPNITVSSESVPFDQLVSQTQARLGSPPWSPTDICWT